VVSFPRQMNQEHGHYNYKYIYLKIHKDTYEAMKSVLGKCLLGSNKIVERRFGKKKSRRGVCRSDIMSTNLSDGSFPISAK
jgi:hypothetical protein